LPNSGRLGLARLPKAGNVAKGGRAQKGALWASRRIGSHNRFQNQQLRFGSDWARLGQLAQSVAQSLGARNRALLNQT